jgi:hypothetical protein
MEFLGANREGKGETHPSFDLTETSPVPHFRPSHESESVIFH